MNFADLRFWLLLLGALSCALLVRIPVAYFRGESIGGYDRASLGIVGLFLLGCVSIQTLVIFTAVSMITFAGLHMIVGFSRDQESQRKWLLPLIALQVAPLLWYKYGDFFGNGILNLGLSGVVHVAIPIGISFYTFQLVSFAVDTLVHGRPLPSAVNSLNFAGFFPQIVAGPIERRDALLPQLEKFRYRWDRKLVETGLSWIILGLFFKRCMADNLAANALHYDGGNPYLIWLDTLLFGFRIYFDFCGYSLMALGVACCLGIRLTLNFRSPYCARNIGDFWRRWHVTLSTWFRDYIYIPLGGGRTAFWASNILIVFVVSGIWHGAGWNFIVWGALHGLFLVAFRLSGKISLPLFVAYGLTHLSVFFAWLCFYETNTAELFRKIGILLSPSTYLDGAFGEFTTTLLSVSGFNILAILLMVLAIVVLEALSLKWSEKPYEAFRSRLIVVLMIFLTVFLAPTGKNEFIYFAF